MHKAINKLGKWQQNPSKIRSDYENQRKSQMPLTRFELKPFKLFRGKKRAVP